MKAAVRTYYGLPGDLSIKELEIPTPKENEVLIKVHASTVNRSDCHVLTGKPWFMRISTGLFKPRESIIGSDFAGQIESVGSDISTFREGEEIMGFGGVFGCGAHSQYFVLTEEKALQFIVRKPKQMSFEESAACLEGAFYAASCVNQLTLLPGQKALVYGATGAIGSSYVQFLKYYGLYVTAVCGGENASLMYSLGADKLIDYKSQDFTKDDERYDFVFDAVGKSSFFKCRKLLKAKGIFTSSNGLINFVLVLTTQLFRGKRVVFPIPKTINSDLRFIKELIEAGKFKPVIDRIYPLDKIAEAYVYVASGQKMGNVIIKM